mgnify:FL=1
MSFGSDSPFPLHDDQLKKWSQRGYMMDFLKSRAVASRSFEQYDFNIKALDTTNTWTIAATSTATTWAVLAEPGGWLRGVTGASLATAALQIYQPQKYWNGTAGAGFASLIRLSSAVGVRLEQGFADVLPAIGTTAVNLPSNAFNSVASGAVYLYDDGSASAAVSGLYTIGTSTAYAAAATTTNRYDSAATLFVAVEVNGRNAQLWVGPPGKPLVSVSTVVTAADGLLPFIMVKKVSGGSINLDLDLFATWTLGRV